MKRYFVETNGYNFVAFVDENNKGYYIDEMVFEEDLTLDVAKNHDYSAIIDCKTAEECAVAILGDPEANVFEFDIDSEDYESVTEF